MWYRCLIVLTLLATALALFVPPTDLPETSYDESESPFAAVVCSPVTADISVAQQQPAVVHHAVAVHVGVTFTSEPFLSPLPVTPPAPPVQHALLC